MRRVVACAVVAAAVAWASTARAEASDRGLRYDLAWDLSITLGGSALWVGSELAKGSLAPSTCRWCDRNVDGSDALNGLDSSVRDRFKWGSTGTADTLGSVAGFALAPVAAAGVGALAAAHDDRLSGYGVDALVVAEAVIIAADVNQATKFLVGRERPFVHVLPPDQKTLTSQPSDNNLSFFSGHTTLAFALAAASGTVANMRRYRLTPVVWAVGMTIAAATGYLRVAADKHYFTDVVTGALVGSGVGVGVPLLFHRPEDPSAPRLSVKALPRGTFASVSWIF